MKVCRALGPLERLGHRVGPTAYSLGSILSVSSEIYRFRRHRICIYSNKTNLFFVNMGTVALLRDVLNSASNSVLANAGKVHTL